MTAPNEVQNPTSHGGILFPLEMFRPTMLATIIGESFVAKARNVLDARVELTRHKNSQLVMMRLHASIVEDPATFWRENADLALILSQVMPRQVFLYYVSEEPKRQGFIVAQQGQAIAGDDADDSMFAKDAPESDWPVAKLAGQLRCSVEELASGFEGGPRIELALMEPTGDDRELLMTLADQGADEASNGQAPAPLPDAAPPQASSQPSSQPSSESSASIGAQAAAAPRRRSPGELEAEAEADRKRRAAEKDEEAALRKNFAKRAQGGLTYVQDQLGLVVAMEAELADTDVLSPFVIRKVAGELPAGLPPELTEELQGQRIDIAVQVDFLSEVIFDGSPLDKARLAEHAETMEIDGLEFQRIAVLAPRLGSGTLVRRGKAGVYISREPSKQMPEALILAQCGMGK